MNFCDVELSGAEAVIVCNSMCSGISGRKLSKWLYNGRGSGICNSVRFDADVGD